MAEFTSSATIRAFLVLDGEGERIYAQYWDGPFSKDFSSQKLFERELHIKSIKANARSDIEAMMFDSSVVLYKFCSDAFFYIVCSDNENELILCSVLSAIEEAMQSLLRTQLDKRILIEQLDLLVLVVDEAIDDGMILENDPESIASRVLMRGTDGESMIPLGEQSLKQAMATAKDQFLRSFQ